MNYFNEIISEKVWDLKYRYRQQDKIIDQTIENTWERVAATVAKAEHRDHKKWEQTFYDALAGFRFLPGGRILAGAGTNRTVTLFNCFVMPIAEDSLSGIFDALKEGALTLQQGGGVGYDFSKLRPHGFLVKHAGTTASGPVSFMRIWNAMCATMESSGARRGAMMGILRCDHPDIEEFIQAKSNPNELRHFNVSVLVTDVFMQAVKEDRDWELVFPVEEDVSDTILRQWSGSAEPVPCRIIKSVRARQLWEKIIKSAYDYAEPGVLFEGTINRQNNLWYREWMSATNPCGEIPLPAYGACNLGSINLTQFVKQPFTQQADLDWQALEKITVIATRFLDNVIDLSHYPLKMQKHEVYLTRRIGLGITGLANVCVMLGLTYGEEKSIQLASKVMQIIAETTWYTSIELAKERGVFPVFQSKKFLQGRFVERLPAGIQEGIEKNGIRNSHHNAIAPAGTISLLANNISNGLEPIFSGLYERTIRTSDGELLKFSVRDYALQIWEQLEKKDNRPPKWTDVQSKSLNPLHHLKMQAAVQPYIDNAISKTINIPEDFPFDNLAEIYTKAFELGLKGCTIYRPNPITGSVLTTIPDDEVDRCCQIL